ncbi:MAG: hypothetical protein IT445_00140 [Phycisphaeraceae bacterium]|nr:hypothetical protein [Phycisphaeraceae bacterium]
MRHRVRESDWKPMDAVEREAALALSPGRVCYPVASSPKRLARSLAAMAEQAEPRMTDRQRVAMWKQVIRFRRQIAGNIVRNGRARLPALEDAIVIEEICSPAAEPPAQTPQAVEAVREQLLFEEATYGF